MVIYLVEYNCDGNNYRMYFKKRDNAIEYEKTIAERPGVVEVVVV